MSNDSIEFKNGPDLNWGKLTSILITELDWAQGTHASDPLGTGPQNIERVGLARVTGEPDMEATTDFIATLIPEVYDYL